MKADENPDVSLQTIAFQKLYAVHAGGVACKPMAAVKMNGGVSNE
jgi:hypothetical protein